MLKIYNNKLTANPRSIIALLLVPVITLSLFAFLLPRQSNSMIANAAACGDVYNPIPSWVRQRVNENKAIYIQVAQETGVPWEMLAAVHYREFNLRRDINPANHQGIYQMYSIYQTDTNYQRLANANAKVTDANFREQTRYAARFLQDKAQHTTRTPIVSPRKLTVNEQSMNLIKSTLFSYNGRASSYAAQAETYGFNRVNQPFEGSPYVMNKFDCNRSSMKLITTDGSNTPTVPDTRLGAFTLYARLKGDSYWMSLIKRPMPQCRETRVNCVWEFENEDTGKRFYTTDATERDHVYSMNFQPVGIAFHTRKANDPNSVPVYRLYNLREDYHFWTPNAAERNSLINTGQWRDEGVKFYMDPPHANTGDPVRRLYSTQKGGQHILTSDGNAIKRLLASGYRNEGVAFVTVSRNTQASIPAAGMRNVYRFHLPNAHFWTQNISERNKLISQGHQYEGVAWESPVQGAAPVYRIYSPEGRHFWTTNSKERDNLVRIGWRDEGVSWRTNNAGNDIYRVYNTRTGRHLWTQSRNEQSGLVQLPAWRDEGVSWRHGN